MGLKSLFENHPGVVRLINPILLLEHGLQIANYTLGTLFWVMGLTCFSWREVTLSS
jgi:hypothetical protein